MRESQAQRQRDVRRAAPYNVTLEAGQVAVLSDWTINPPPPDENFVPIANGGQEQRITDARYPGLEIKLPAGVSIVGWDGVPKSRIAVERIPVDKLPVPRRRCRSQRPISSTSARRWAVSRASPFR